MKLRLAHKREQAQISSILKQAAERLKAKGSQQWQQLLTGSEEPVIAARLANQTLYVVELTKGQIVAVCYLYTEPSSWDVDLWQESAQPNIYYLHRVALANNVVGQNLGAEFIQAIQNYIQSKAGHQIIRLDCVSYLAVLNQLYQSCGFQKVGLKPEIAAGDLIADFNLYQWETSV